MPETKTFSKGKFQGLLKIRLVAKYTFLQYVNDRKEHNEKHMRFKFSLEKQELDDWTSSPESL